jgi:hypothetical protein
MKTTLNPKRKQAGRDVGSKKNGMAKPPCGSSRNGVVADGRMPSVLGRAAAPKAIGSDRQALFSGGKRRGDCGASVPDASCRLKEAAYNPAPPGE